MHQICIKADKTLKKQVWNNMKQSNINIAGLKREDLQSIRSIWTWV